MLKLPCTCHSPLCHTRLNTFLSLLSCGKVQSQVFAPNIYLMLGGVSLWFLVVYSKQPSVWLTQEWFREWSCSRLECRVHDSRHQIEGTNGLFCLIRTTQAMWGKRTCPRFEAATLSYYAPSRDSQSQMLRTRFVQLI